LVETKDVSNVLTESLIKSQGYCSRYSDHATTGATKVSISGKTRQFFFLTTAQVGSAALSTAFFIFAVVYIDWNATLTSYFIRTCIRDRKILGFCFGRVVLS